MRRVAVGVFVLGVGFVFRTSFGQDLALLLEEAARSKAEGRWEDCLAALEKVVDRAAEDEANAALAQCRIDEAYIAMSKPEKAEQALRRMEREFPQHTEAIQWARCLFSTPGRRRKRLGSARGPGSSGRRRLSTKRWKRFRSRIRDRRWQRGSAARSS